MNKDDNTKPKDKETDPSPNFGEGSTTNKYKTRIHYPLRVVLLGRAGGGKTTLLRGLLQDVVVCENSLYRGTKDPYQKNVIVEDNNSGLLYSLQIIDTPGLFEFYAKTQEQPKYPDKKDELKAKEIQKKRDDDNLLKIFSEFMIEADTVINCVIIVHDGSKRLDDKDVEVWEKILKYFGDDFKKNIMFVVTHADLLSKRQREVYKNEFETEPLLSIIKQKAGLGLFFSSQCLERFSDRVDIFKEEIGQDKDQFLTALISTGERPQKILSISDLLDPLDKALRKAREACLEEAKYRGCVLQ